MSQKEKIVLKDLTEYEIENGAAQGSITMLILTLAEFNLRFEKMSEENLSEYTIKNADGLTCITLQNKIVKEVAVSTTADGFKLVFGFTDVDVVAKRLNALEERTDTLDGAVEDLGAITSTLAATQEGETI